MTLNQLKDRYNGLRPAARALGKAPSTLASWIKSDVTRQVLFNEEGRPEVWRKE